MDRDPEAVLIAVSLYLYNVSLGEIADEMADFIGQPEEREYILERLKSRTPYLATEFPYQSLNAFTKLALARYYDEALRRVTANRKNYELRK